MKETKKLLGRPNTINAKAVTITLPEALIERLKKETTNRSETIRLALEEYLKTK